MFGNKHVRKVMLLLPFLFFGGLNANAVESKELTVRAAALKSGEDVISMPSAARIVGGFILTIGLAIAVAYAVKRFLPKFNLPVSGNTALQVQTSIHGGIRYHVVSVQDQTVLVAEGRSGIAMAVLPPPAKKL